MYKPKRRDFLKQAGAFAALAPLPISLVNIAQGAPGEDFTFAYISDSHIQHIKGSEFVANWDHGLKRAVAEVNLLAPKPDFVIFGGDLAQLAKKEELDHGAEMLSKLNYDVRYVMGEHDYYLDDGKYWEELFGPQWYSFDHKGVHFVVLNSILTYEKWNQRWASGEERMAQMALLDNPQGSPFMVGEKQRQWLKDDLAKVDKNTPLVVLSHSPIQKIFKNWNFWTDDAEEVQALLKPFKKVTVIYGHVHQIQYNQIGNISFQSVMATAWPWPYPESYELAENHLPVMTVPMNRADPHLERDATGWQFIGMDSGRVAMDFILPNNENRRVAYNASRGRPEDQEYQPKSRRIPPQNHY